MSLLRLEAGECDEEKLLEEERSSLQSKVPASDDISTRRSSETLILF